MKALSTLAVLMTLAAPLAAQQPGARDSMPARMPGHEMMPHMMQMGEMMEPMMRAMAFAPAHLLERRDALGLTAQQIARLTALREAAKSAQESGAAEAKRHLEALARTMEASAPDTTALRQHFEAAHGAMGSAHWAALRAASDGRAVLTDAQRGRVDGWVDAMQMQRRMRMSEQGHQHERP